MIAGLLALIVSAADPCSPAGPPPPPDPATAALYRETGDAERAAGHPATAAAAYARAAALDPADAASRAALAQLCQAPAGQADPFEEGLRLMEAGELRDAAASFAPGRRAGDRSAALLEGVCLYRLGDDQAAEVALREAVPAPEHRDLASFYLGLVALRTGRASQAATFFDATRSNAGLGDMAATLARLARRDGRLVVSLMARGGFDSNVSLSPRGATTGWSSGGMMGGGSMPSAAFTDGDGLYDLSAAALWRPLGPSGPYLRGAGAVRHHFQKSAYDLGGVEGAAGWQRAADGHGLLGELSYGWQQFGASPYLQLGRLATSGWVTTGDLTWSATWTGALQRHATAYRAFDGTLQQLQVKVAWAFGSWTWLGLAYAGSSDAARSGIAAYLDHGPRLEWRAVLSPSWRVGLDGGVTFRRYDAFDATLGARQADTFLDGTAFLERDLSDRWTFRLSTDCRNALSNVPASEYVKLQGMAALIYTFGI